MSKEYILKEGGLHQRFLESRAKVQFFGGGYGNGKTSAMIMKLLQIAHDYPGAQILVARSTYPKLNDTIRKTFIEFCPSNWIANFPMSKNSENTCTLTNGSQFFFRYISQRKSTDDGGTTSNLLSATYDVVCVDQIEDPEIKRKDFNDLFGRLRGSTVYRGSDPTMPRTGPRWVLISSNPTRNWVYKYIIAPLKKYQATGIITPDLMCRRRDDQVLLGPDGKPQLMIELFEGSTYENAHVLEADFIEGLESQYTGQMRDRFLKGEWVAYEGLVYPEFDEPLHMVPQHKMVTLLSDLRKRRYNINFVECYDFGIASPSCYMFGFVDDVGNVHLLDGFYKKEYTIEQQAQHITRIRNRWNGEASFIMSDPDIFRRKSGQHKTVGKSVNEMFFDLNSDLQFTRGNNDIINGIIKVGQYFRPYQFHRNPYDGSANAPYIYISQSLNFVAEEAGAYYWDKDDRGENDDAPVDGNDHALDAIKYLLSDRPDVTQLMRSEKIPQAYLTEWSEKETKEDMYRHRH